MANKTQTIRIESILGGHAPTTHFAASNQFRSSVGIDPAQPLTDSSVGYGYVSSGLLRPVPVSKISGSVISNPPLWIVPNPKNNIVYVYDSAGSVYSISETSNTATAVGDLNDGGTATGNGAAYYDNYAYFSRSTTIARYGPLDGSPSFTDDFWSGTLGLTALTNTTYPSEYFLTFPYANHILHRHSDGKLYIADVVGNQGTIHFIKTSKTTIEGDTNDGSTYAKLQVGYGLWPTAMESYGSNLVIAFYEGATGTHVPKQRAKIAFWDTTSDKVSQITWNEFPDQVITGLKNINGVLYVVSGHIQIQGFRLSRYVGGYTFEEVFVSETGEPPLQGAIDGDSNRVLFGSFLENSTNAHSAVFSYGLQKASLGHGVFAVQGTTGSTSATATALSLAFNRQPGFNYPLVGWTSGYNDGEKNGVDYQSMTYNNSVPVWWSQTYRIGQPFKITKIRIPLAQAVATNMTVTPKIYVDDDTTTSYTLTAINNTNYPGEKNILFRSDANSKPITGKHNFWLELVWSGSALCTVGLPITIEYEFIDD